MNGMFTQPTGSVAKQTNKQAIARHFGVKQSEVVYFSVGAVLSGYKVIYDKETQRAYSLPDLGSWVTAISLSPAGVLVHSAGSVDLGALAVTREEYVTLPGSFATGVTVNAKNELVVFTNGKYRWDGALPKKVPANSTPETAGEIGLGAWVSVGDASLRTDISGDSGIPIVSPHKVKVSPQGSLAQTRLHVTPEMYGAVGDGVADDTVPVRKALIAAATAGIAVFGKEGSVYGVVSTISIPASLTELAYMRLDVIRPTSSGELSELLSFIGTGSSRITIDIHHNYITCNAKVRQPIVLDGTRRCKIRNNTILGVDTPECYGIRLGISNSGVDNLYNDIYENYIVVGADPDNGAGLTTRNGIVAFGNYADPGASGPDWGGVPSSVQNTRIFNNIVLGGTHNLHLRGCNVIDIFGNTFSGGSHRNINLSTMCQRVHIHDNSLLNAGSAGVVMGNNRWVKINDNYIYSSVSAAVATDDAGIQGDLWIENLEVQNNTIHGDWTWGIHLLTLRGGNITNNDIQASWAAVAVESSSVDLVPELAKYTKRRSVVYPAITNTYDVLISNNRYAAPSTGCGIYIAGQSGKAVARVTISDNIRTGGTVGDEIYIFNNDLVTNVDVKSHSSAGAVVSNYTDTGVSVRSVGQCTGLDVQAVSVAGDAQSFGVKAFVLTAAVAVTNFIGGYSNGDVITVRGFPEGSLVQDSSRIRLRGNVTATFADSNGIITLQRQAGIWFEIARNF